MPNLRMHRTRCSCAGDAFVGCHKMTRRKVILSVLIGVAAIPIMLIIAGNLYVALAPPSM